MENWRKFEILTEVLDKKVMLDAIKSWMSEDMLGEMCDDISCDYDINIEDYEDYA